MMVDISSKNYAQFLQVEVEVDDEDEPEEIHAPFTSEELDLLWSKVNEIEGIDTILIMAYSGLRPSELLQIETEKVDVDKRIMRGGIKSSAGKNRIVPINKKILPLIVKRITEGNKYLITLDQKKISYAAYRKNIWNPIMAKLNLDHLPHDGRHTCGTFLDNLGANRTAVKKIPGHSTKKDVTNTYTHKDIEQLLKAIDLTSVYFVYITYVNSGYFVWNTLIL